MRPFVPLHHNKKSKHNKSKLPNPASLVASNYFWKAAGANHHWNSREVGWTQQQLEPVQIQRLLVDHLPSTVLGLAAHWMKWWQNATWLDNDIMQSNKEAQQKQAGCIITKGDGYEHLLKADTSTRAWQRGRRWITNFGTNMTNNKGCQRIKGAHAYKIQNLMSPCRGLLDIVCLCCEQSKWAQPKLLWALANNWYGHVWPKMESMEVSTSKTSHQWHTG